MVRLRVQSLALEPSAESMLDAVGISPGWSALDLACGPVGLLRPLSTRVGATGKVVGLDLDLAEVSAARDHVRELGLSNVTVIEGDAFHTGFEAEAFDLVHARFLIAPVGHAHDLVAEMIRVARPGGVVVLEEPVASAWSCFPESAGFDRLKEVIRECFRRGGGDFDAGRGSFTLLRGAGLTDVQCRGVVLTLHDRHPYMHSAVQFADSLRSRILADRLMTEAELDRATEEVERAIARPETSMVSFPVVQAWGRKPTGAIPGRGPA